MNQSCWMCGETAERVDVQAQAMGTTGGTDHHCKIDDDGAEVCCDADRGDSGGRPLRGISWSGVGERGMDCGKVTMRRTRRASGYVMQTEKKHVMQVAGLMCDG
jgi:hypothetical protein